MFTRRTATVTISAPDASTAAAFCSKSLYLPVPTISRELKLRPATCQRSSNSASAHEGDDLELVAIFHPDLAERRARHDLEVALDRDLGRLEPQFERQFGERQSGAHAPMLAIDPDRKRAFLIHYRPNLCACGMCVI